MFRTIEELAKSFANGSIKLDTDEYIGEYGLPYCKKCKTPRFMLIDMTESTKYAMRGKCKCQKQEEQYQEEKERREKNIIEFRARQSLSMLGKRYLNVRFNNSVITDKNSDAFKACINYVEKANEVYEENIGLYLYGDNSSGKTHLTACICNELVYRGWRCIYTNFATILNEIKSSYNGAGLGEQDIIARLKNCNFAFIDDLGKEFIGREYNAATSKWAENKLFEIINARYNDAQPTIFSSNYSISELSTVLRLDKAIVERVNELSTRVIKLNGEDFRMLSLDEKKDRAKKLGI